MPTYNSPMNSDTITTARLNIVPFQQEHITQKYIDWLNNKQLMRYSQQRHQLHSVETCSEYVKSFDHETSFLWAILYAADNNQHIGNVSAYLDTKNSVCDLGLLIGNPNLQGIGIGYEAWASCIEYFQVKKAVRKITGGCMAKNSAMLSIMKKSGMQDDGIRKQQFRLDGDFVDAIHMAIFLT